MRKQHDRNIKLLAQSQEMSEVSRFEPMLSTTALNLPTYVSVFLSINGVNNVCLI